MFILSNVLILILIINEIHNLQFSVKYNLHKSELGITQTFMIIAHLKEKLISSYFADSMLFSYFRCLKSYMISVSLFKNQIRDKKLQLSEDIEGSRKLSW